MEGRKDIRELFPAERSIGIAPFAGGPFDAQEQTVEASPCNECPAGTVPQTAEQHGDGEIDVGALDAGSVTTERYVEVVAQPIRQ